MGIPHPTISVWMALSLQISRPGLIARAYGKHTSVHESSKLCLTALCTIPGTFERSGGLGPDGQIPIEVAAVTFRLTA